MTAQAAQRAPRHEASLARSRSLAVAAPRCAVRPAGRRSQQERGRTSTRCDETSMPCSKSPRLSPQTIAPLTPPHRTGAHSGRDRHHPHTLERDTHRTGCHAGAADARRAHRGPSAALPPDAPAPHRALAQPADAVGAVALGVVALESHRLVRFMPKMTLAGASSQGLMPISCARHQRRSPATTWHAILRKHLRCAMTVERLPIGRSASL